MDKKLLLIYDNLDSADQLVINAMIETLSSKDEQISHLRESMDKCVDQLLELDPHMLVY